MFVVQLLPEAAVFFLNDDKSFCTSPKPGYKMCKPVGEMGKVIYYVYSLVDVGIQLNKRHAKHL